MMLNERVSAADFESEHFAALLVERLGWAVTDASAVEERPGRRRADRGGYRCSASVVTTAS